MDKVIKLWKHTRIFRDQASYTVDNKPVRSMKWRPLGGRREMAPFILNLKARHIECSTSCYSQSLCQPLGV